MRFEWDEAKNASNQRKHGISFETATAVFYDSYHSTAFDGVIGDEERWSTIGRVGDRFLVIVERHRGG